MRDTRFVSQFGAFWMFMFSILELWNTWVAVSKADQIADETWAPIFKISLFHAVIGITFALRFFLLFFYRPNYFVTAQLTWLVGAVLVLYHLISTFLHYDGHIFHMMYNPLIITEFVFILFSLFRFTATSWLSFVRSNEFNPNS